MCPASPRGGLPRCEPGKYIGMMGYCIPKPELIFKLDQGEQLWVLEAESPSQSYPELIIEKNYLRKNSDDLSAYENLFLRVNHEKAHVREKPYELIKNRKYVSQNEDFFPYEKIKHVEQCFEYKECGENFCEKTVFITYKQARKRQGPCEHNECDKTFCNYSILMVHKIRESLYEFNAYGKTFEKYPTGHQLLPIYQLDEENFLEHVPLHLKNLGAELDIAYLIAKLILQHTGEHHH
ncbi:hypothetical protein JEQ12_012881 [Ovis aries]|uniref:KRAB domain-containing protein n=1 Tax=Ovis aries TaxID=9940 RepID=A0A836CPZ8_SHEEP|nr:hypothetical protein JEQ12_012881 [Ovis aries]